MAKIRAGSRAAITFHMHEATVRVVRMCGEAETVSVGFIAYCDMGWEG